MGLEEKHRQSLVSFLGVTSRSSQSSGCKGKHVGHHANARLFHFHAHSSATARQPGINKNVLDTFQWAYIYIHVLELFRFVQVSEKLI